MYRSSLDAAPEPLTFEFDPLRPLHAHSDSALAWPEFPYKQVTLDRLCAKFLRPRLSCEAAAGAMLLARGDFGRAVFEVEQHFRHDVHSLDAGDGGGDGSLEGMNPGWLELVDRFHRERAAFRDAKRDFIRGQKALVASKLAAIDQAHADEAERLAQEAWRGRQILKRHEDGSKYDGEGVRRHGVLIPHGQGTLWVPQKASVNGDLGDLKRVPKYTGEWADGLMHGRGTYFWRNGDSWAGHFCRDELHGRGIYTIAGVVEGDDPNPDEAVDSSRLDPAHAEQRVRYYDTSQHVCWGEDLAPGRRIRLFTMRRFGEHMAAVIPRRDVALEDEVEYVVLRHDPTGGDRYLVRRSESEETRWLSLHNTSFRLVPGRPITRLMDEGE